MRKKNLLLLFCFVMINVCYGQFETGKRMIGGGIGFNTANNQLLSSNPDASERTTGFLFNASLSRFSSPLLVKGIGIAYGYNYLRSNLIIPSNEYTSYAHLIGAFVNRAKLQPIGKKIYLAFTGTLTASYGSGKNTYPYNSNVTDTRTYMGSLAGAIGIWYHMSPKWLVTADFNNLGYLSYEHGTYKTTKPSITENRSNNRFVISSSLNGMNLNSIQIGLRYILK
jgi:hypothetical protein